MNYNSIKESRENLNLLIGDKEIGPEPEIQAKMIGMDKKSDLKRKGKKIRKRGKGKRKSGKVTFLDFEESNEIRKTEENTPKKGGKRLKQKPPKRKRSKQLKDTFLNSAQLLKVEAEDVSQEARELLIPNLNLNDEVPLINFKENNLIKESSETPISVDKVKTIKAQKSSRKRSRLQNYFNKSKEMTADLKAEENSLDIFSTNSTININHEMQISQNQKSFRKRTRLQNTPENCIIHSKGVTTEHLHLKAEENSLDLFSTSQFVEKNTRKRKSTRTKRKIKENLQQSDEESNELFIKNPFYSPVLPKIEPTPFLTSRILNYSTLQYNETTQQESTLPHPREYYNIANTRIPIYRPAETLVDCNYTSNNYNVYDFEETENTSKELKHNRGFALLPSLTNPFAYDYNSVKCDLCLARVHRDVLALHRLSHTEESIYRCLWCNKASFRYKKALANHIIRHYTNVITKGGYTRCKKDPYRVCDVCNARVHKSSLNRHRESHENKKHVCDICQQQFTTVWNMRRHLRIHTGEKRFQCNICQNYLSTKEKLNQHLLTHSGFKPFECEICKQRYTTKYTLDIHKRNTNHTTSNHQPQSNTLQCNICQTVFTTLRNYAVHKFFNHPEECVEDAVKTNELMCEVCFETCETVESFKAHLMGHMKRHLCLICKVECGTKQGLLNHMVELHDEM